MLIHRHCCFVRLLLMARRATGAIAGVVYFVSGTFRIPLLFSGLRRFLYVVSRGASRLAGLMYITTGITLIKLNMLMNSEIRQR